MSSYRRTLYWAAALALLFMTMELLGAKLTGHYSLYQVVCMRYAVHLVIMLGWLGKGHLLLSFRTPKLTRQIARSLLMLAMPVCWISAFHAGADMAAGLGTMPILLPVALSLAHTHAMPPQNVIAVLLLLASAAGAASLGRPAHQPIRRYS